MTPASLSDALDALARAAQRRGGPRRRVARAWRPTARVGAGRVRRLRADARALILPLADSGLLAAAVSTGAPASKCRRRLAGQRQRRWRSTAPIGRASPRRSSWTGAWSPWSTPTMAARRRGKCPAPGPNMSSCWRGMPSRCLEGLTARQSVRARTDGVVAGPRRRARRRVGAEATRGCWSPRSSSITRPSWTKAVAKAICGRGWRADRAGAPALRRARAAARALASRTSSRPNWSAHWPTAMRRCWGRLRDTVCARRAALGLDVGRVAGAGRAGADRAGAGPRHRAVADLHGASAAAVGPRRCLDRPDRRRRARAGSALTRGVAELADRARRRGRAAALTTGGRSRAARLSAVLPGARADARRAHRRGAPGLGRATAETARRRAGRRHPPARRANSPKQRATSAGAVDPLRGAGRGTTALARRPAAAARPRAAGRRRSRRRRRGVHPSATRSIRSATWRRRRGAVDRPRRVGAARKGIDPLRQGAQARGAPVCRAPVRAGARRVRGAAAGRHVGRPRAGVAAAGRMRPLPQAL